MASNLDIAFVATGDPRLDTFSAVSSGGAGPIRRLGETFADRGHSVTIYAGTHGAGSVERVDGCLVHNVPTPNLEDPTDWVLDSIPGIREFMDTDDLSTLPGEAIERLLGRLVFSKRVASILRTSRHDIVYLRDRITGFFPSRLSMPSVFTVVAPDACLFYYDQSISTHPANAILFRYKRAIERSVVAHTDHTIVMNQKTKREYRTTSNDISIVTLGVDERSFVDLPNRTEHPVVLYVGRFDSNKRPELVLEAFETLDRTGFELHFVGSGPREEYVRDLSRDSRVSERVHFHGTIPRSRVLELMRTASVLVLPSRFENCPNVIVEAMASGCPVIASDTMGASQLIDDGKTGVLFEKDDAASLREALEELLENEHRRRNIAEEAHQYALGNHTVEVIADQYLEIGRQACVQHE